jgi:hypothetical protein
MKLNLQTMTTSQKDEFLKGWENAGGYMDDLDSDNPNPWGCPWYWCDKHRCRRQDFRRDGG